MNFLIRDFLYIVSMFYIGYLIIFATYSFFSILIGSYRMYVGDRLLRFNNKLKHDDLPISVLVPAHNEAVAIVDNIRSLLSLDYRLYEIIIVDDGSGDNTSQELIDEFDLKPVDRQIEMELSCNPATKIYESVASGVSLTLIIKENGGKGDALNMAINASRYDYVVCMDADSRLQPDSLKEIVEPVFEDDSTVAVGGLIMLSQCVQIEDGMIKRYRLPKNLLVSMQAV